MKNSVLTKLFGKFVNDRQLVLKKLRRVLIAIITISLVVYVAYLGNLYVDYHFVQKDQINIYLDGIGKELIEQSSNNTELISNIILWQRDYFISPKTNSFDTFDSAFENRYLRPNTPDPLWSIYLKKASCGELACVFGDLVTRTGLTYRPVYTTGFIDPYRMTVNNHAWSEVQLESGEWVIADVGFNAFPPINQSIFYSQYHFLMGPIFYVENETHFNNMESYIPNTQKVIIHALRNGKDITGGLIYVNLHYNGSSLLMGMPYKTNESGMAEVTLGVYDGVTYTIGVIEPETKDYTFRSNILLGADTGITEITLDEWNTSNKLIGGYILFILIIVFIGEVLIVIDINFFKLIQNISR